MPPSLPAAAITVLLLAACTNPDTSIHGVTVSDSSCVEIVLNPDPSHSDSTSLKIDTLPWVTIGSHTGDAPYLFTRIVGATRLSDGRIAVADGGTAEIRLFDSAGRFLAKTGRLGVGPGEYPSISRMMRHVRDSLLLYNLDENRVIGVHDPNGAFVRTIKYLFGDSLLNPYGDATPHHVFADGSLLLVALSKGCGPYMQLDGPCEFHSNFWRAQESGSTVAIFGSMPSSRSERYVRPARRGSFVLYDFMAPVFWGVHGSHFYYADATTFEVRVFRADGSLRRIVRADYQQARPPDLPMREMSGNREFNATDFAAAWARAAKPDLLRAYDGLHVDLQGQIWLREYTVGQPAPPRGERWWVFDSTGVVRGSARVPPVAAGGRSDIQTIEIGEGYLLRVESDSLGVESVKLYRIRSSAK
jgi:hypothetical protein